MPRGAERRSGCGVGRRRSGWVLEGGERVEERLDGDPFAGVFPCTDRTKNSVEDVRMGIDPEGGRKGGQPLANCSLR